MKTKQTIVRLTMALAIMFGVQLSASAQLGKLKGLADKAKSSVTKTKKADTNVKTTTTAETPAVTPVAPASKNAAPKEVAPQKQEDFYVSEIEYNNYLLNDLSDRNRNAKAVADYKAKVNAKVKAEKAPTRILGTYSTSPAWQGLYLPDHPELQEKYRTVQEMQFKTFYEKDGKYYVLKSAFRQSIPKDDIEHGAQPDKSYWPGLERAVEVPAEKIKEHFK